jgi:hypothetical protein
LGDVKPRAAELAARQTYGKLVTYLGTRTGEVAAAEDDAFAATLDWPTRGVSQSPGLAPRRGAPADDHYGAPPPHPWAETDRLPLT